MTIEDYIRSAAKKRGIDPDIAVRVAKSEGGLNNPVNQSNVTKNGRREPSYGPFQLLVGGGDSGFPTGMGNDALRMGIDPRDPNQWQRGVDFALDNAVKNGWGAWYGAKNVGIGNRQGIGNAARVLGTSFAKPMPQNPTSSPVAPGGDVSIAPPITTSKQISDRPVFDVNSDHMRYDAMASQAPIDTAEGATPVDSTFFGRIAEKLRNAGNNGNNDNNDKFKDGIAAMQKATDQNQEAQAAAHNTPIQSNIGAMDGADAARIANATQLMNALLKQRRQGFGTSFVG